MSGSGFSNDAAKLILDAAFGGTAFSPSTYVALTTALVTRTDDCDSLTECAYASYARVAVSSGDFSAAADPGTKTNDSQINFPASTGAPARRPSAARWSTPLPARVSSSSTGNSASRSTSQRALRLSWMSVR